MNNERFLKLVDDSIKLENKVGELYLAFHNTHPEDAAFWWELSLEERNHASLLRSGRDYFFDAGLFPEELLLHSINDLEQNIGLLEKVYYQNSNTPFSREETFNIAHYIETCAGELHLQQIMKKESNSKAMEVFKKLNKDDLDHAERIEAYANRVDIQIDKSYEPDI